MDSDDKERLDFEVSVFVCDRDVFQGYIRVEKAINWVK
jgi:hypothetical protein